MNTENLFYNLGSQPLWYSRPQSFIPSLSKMRPVSALTLNDLLIRDEILA